MTYDEQHISQETLSHLGAVLPCPSEETVDLGCVDSREHLEELESLEGIEHVETDEVTEGEDSNATINVSKGGYQYINLGLQTYSDVSKLVPTTRILLFKSCWFPWVNPLGELLIFCPSSL